MDDVAFWPASRQAAAIRAGELSSRDLLETYLERVGKHNPTINAVVTLAADEARDAADAADAAVSRGESVGPLHGLAVTIKDALETAGIRSTGGAVELAEHVPSGDAAAVARVRAAGAIVFGKTNLPRWSGDGQSYNELFGVTSNPWDLSRSPGGSSGGAAAAVAAGLTSFELGTDIGGSVRMPSHFCGIWGHKPTFGLVPGFGYLDSVNGGLVEADNNVIGPMARSVDDLDLLLDVMAGPVGEAAKAWSVRLPPPRHERLSDYRVAVWLDDPLCPVDSEMRQLIERAVGSLAAAGAKVDRSARPDVDFAEASRLGMRLISVATSVGLPIDKIEELAEASRGSAALVQRHHTWLERHRRRTQIRAAWAEFFTSFDVLLCPVTITPAFKHQIEGTWATRRLEVDGESRPYGDLMPWSALIGMAYLPVTTPPLGRTAQGLPVSVQVVGPYLEDRTAIDLARRLADAAGAGYVAPSAFR
jgi:amidase